MAKCRVHWRARSPRLPPGHGQNWDPFGGYSVLSLPSSKCWEKVGKRGSMPKLIAQRPAIGSWTWSRDCVYWCCLAGLRGLADGHPPTTIPYILYDSSKAEENDGHRRHTKTPLRPLWIQRAEINQNYLVIIMSFHEFCTLPLVIMQYQITKRIWHWMSSSATGTLKVKWDIQWESH